MQTPHTIHFLLVEDDSDHAELVTRALKKNKVANTVDHVADGVEALAYLRRQGSYHQSPRPDLVLLDLNLPKLSGLKVLAAAKEDEHLKSIPIVVLTTSDAEIDRTRAYKNHTNSYLVKPLDFARFNQMIQDLKSYWGLWNRSPAAV